MASWKITVEADQSKEGRLKIGQMRQADGWSSEWDGVMIVRINMSSWIQKHKETHITIPQVQPGNFFDLHGLKPWRYIQVLPS
jgi:hypothetical protein